MNQKDMGIPVLMNTLSYELDVPEDQSWVYARVYDSMTKALFLGLLKDALERARERRVFNFLIDARGVPSKKTTIDDYDIVNYRLKELGYDRLSKTAIIVDPGDSTHDFFETCTMNAGYIWRIFTDEDLAREWLFPT